MPALLHDLISHLPSVKESKVTTIILESPNNNRESESRWLFILINKYVALFVLPFFVVSHVVCRRIHHVIGSFQFLFHQTFLQPRVGLQTDQLIIIFSLNLNDKNLFSKAEYFPHRYSKTPDIRHCAELFLLYNK